MLRTVDMSPPVVGSCEVDSGTGMELRHQACTYGTVLYVTIDVVEGNFCSFARNSVSAGAPYVDVVADVMGDEVVLNDDVAAVVQLDAVGVATAYQLAKAVRVD